MKKTKQTPARKIALPVGLRVPRWTLVHGFISEFGPATYEEIGSGLKQMGHDMKKYPTRTVSAAVSSPYCVGVFGLRKDGDRRVVYLKPTARIKTIPVRSLPAQAGRKALPPSK